MLILSDNDTTDACKYEVLRSVNLPDSVLGIYHTVPRQRSIAVRKNATEADKYQGG